jgi:transcriptional regulator with XRE-family HTH domain
MHIGEYINYKRKSLGYTQQQLADRLSISKQAVNKWEKCLATPDIMILPELGFILKKSPHFLTEIIWRGNNEGGLTHFVLLSVTENNGEEYVLKHFESKDFSKAADLFEKVRRGNEDAALDMLADYYDNDHTRTFQIRLQECETAYLDDPDVGGFLIDSRDITSVIVNYYNKSRPIIECNNSGDSYGK